MRARSSKLTARLLLTKVLICSIDRRMVLVLVLVPGYGDLLCANIANDGKSESVLSVSKPLGVAAFGYVLI